MFTPHPFAKTILSIIISTLIFTPELLQAQALEEIVVTATRRETSLQEVPISVDVYTRDELNLQGYRTLDDLSKYSPSVSISSGIQEQNIAIRSFSTRGNSLTLQSAAPIFVDGIHFGRLSSVKTAFLDTERVEILRGPQPLHFGMNATAGAFNIQSARPTQQWEGNAGAEFGNFGKTEFSGAIGGPITDTLGIRVAGILESDDGPVKNRYSPGDSLPGFHHLGGRASLLWTPRENLSIFSKIERSRQRNGSQLTMGCITGAPLSGFGDTVVQGDDITQRGITGNESSVLANSPIGVGGLAGIILPELATGEDCFRGDYAFGNGGPYLAPPANVNSQQGSRSSQAGSVDSRAQLTGFYSKDGNSTLPGIGGADHGGLEGLVGKDWIDTWNGMFAIDYEFSNGIALTTETGWHKLDRLASRDFRMSPFLMGYQPKEENFQQFSQLLRIDSPAEGIEFGNDLNVDYMAQLYYQQSGLQFWNGNSEAGGLRRPMRFNNGWEKSKWYAASWNLNFNFMEDQLSFQVGGRYTDVKKDVRIGGWGAQFIFDEMPCSADPAENPTLSSDVADCGVDSEFRMLDPTLTDRTYAQASQAPERRVRLDNPQITVENVDLTNLWTPRRWGSRLDVPLNYRGGGVPAVGFTAPVYENAGIPNNRWLERQTANNYDSQVVLSFTPNSLEGNHTFYAKYATAFKGPVTDTGQGGLPTTFGELAFAPEFVTGYETGAKGTVMDGRLRYDFDIFRNDFNDLQTVGAAVVGNVQDQNSVSLNAGKQRVDGIEFSMLYAATDRLTVNVSGSLLDAVFLEFDGDGCSTNEIAAVSVDALANPSNYTVEEVAEAQDFIDSLESDIAGAIPARSAIPDVYFQNETCRLVDGTDFGARTISRKGVVPQDAPDYKFVLGGTYTYPIANTLEGFVNVKGFITDSYRTGRAADPAGTVFFDAGGDINVSAGIGSADGTWKVIAFARNLLEQVPAYHPEVDLIQDPLPTYPLSNNSFTSYGLRLEYNYQ